MLSLMAIVLPRSFPFGAPVMLQRQYLAIPRLSIVASNIRRSKGYPRQRVDILVYGDILLVTWGQGSLIAADKLPVRTEQWHLYIPEFLRSLNRIQVVGIFSRFEL